MRSGILTTPLRSEALWPNGLKKDKRIRNFLILPPTQPKSIPLYSPFQRKKSIKSPMAGEFPGI